jgi:hypothetical protein
MEKKIEKDLDDLAKTVKEQNEVLEACLVQLDQYQHVSDDDVRSLLGQRDYSLVSETGQSQVVEVKTSPTTLPVEFIPAKRIRRVFYTKFWKGSGAGDGEGGAGEKRRRRRSRRRRRRHPIFLSFPEKSDSGI